MATDLNTGFKYTFENAERLYTSAELLAAQKHFSVATSLMVLCAEEAIKAFVIFSQAVWPDMFATQFKKYFEDHKTKLETIRGVRGMASLLQKMNELYYGPMLENIESEKEPVKVVKKRSLDNLIAALEKETATKKTEMKLESAWWRQAKTLKEEGLYVGFKNGKWLPTTSVNSRSWKAAHKYVSKLMEDLRITARIGFEDKEIKKMINSLKKEYYSRIADRL